MPGNSTNLRRFLDAIRDAILARAKSNEPAGRSAVAIFQALDTPIHDIMNQPSRLPACQHLATAFETACDGQTPAAHAARALLAIEPMFNWRIRSDADTYGPRFVDGHGNATIVGPTGLVKCVDVKVGVSLVAPNIRYPDHHHLPEEVYLVLSPGEWCNTNVPWHEPGMGGIVHNPPDITHAMRANNDPLLAVWCLL